MNDNRQKAPQRWANRLLEWICPPAVIESLQGDLYEIYELRRRKGMVKSKADLLFFLGVLSACRSFAFKKESRFKSNYLAMLQHHIKITWRILVRDKMYSAIKVGGFAVAIAICLLIAFFVRDELSVDKQYRNSGRIYRILSGTSNPEAGWTRGSCLPAPIKTALEDNFPEVERVGRLISFDGWYDAGSNLFRPVDHEVNMYEERFAYADQELIDMLEIPMVYGTRSNVLREPKSILISKRKADKYFPGQDPVGEVIILNDDTNSTFVIGGVMENLKNTHLSGFDFFLTLSGREFWDGE
ncbi:MAG: ABC transporter permease, partial [Bacteroidota bacterium]